MTASDDRLRALCQRTRDLIDDLDNGRQDLLSVSDLNRALRQVLRNQLLIMERLASGGPAEPLTSGAHSRPLRPEPLRAEPAAVDHGGNGAGPRISVRQREVEEEAAPPQGWGHDRSADLDELDDPAQRDLSGVVPLDGSELRQLQQALGGVPEEEGGPATSRTESVLKESRQVPKTLAREFVQDFDNRDKDYDKGLEKLNRWVDGGSSGTPFQWRGNRAYLNLGGLSDEAALRYEQQLMTRMGFSRRLGRLTVPELRGEVVLYERP